MYIVLYCTEAPVAWIIWGHYCSLSLPYPSTIFWRIPPGLNFRDECLWNCIETQQTGMAVLWKPSSARSPSLYPTFPRVCNIRKDSLSEHIPKIKEGSTLLSQRDHIVSFYILSISFRGDRIRQPPPPPLPSTPTFICPSPFNRSPNPSSLAEPSSYLPA